MRTSKAWFPSLARICLLALLVGLTPRVLRAQSANMCAPSPAVKVALDQLSRRTPPKTEWQFHDQRAAAIKALLKQYPDDLFVQQVYIHSMDGRSDKDRVITEYKPRQEQNPDSAQQAYLYGVALVGR